MFRAQSRNVLTAFGGAFYKHFIKFMIEWSGGGCMWTWRSGPMPLDEVQTTNGATGVRATATASGSVVLLLDMSSPPSVVSFHPEGDVEGTWMVVPEPPAEVLPFGLYSSNYAVSLKCMLYIFGNSADGHLMAEDILCLDTESLQWGREHTSGAVPHGDAFGAACAARGRVLFFARLTPGERATRTGLGAWALDAASLRWSALGVTDDGTLAPCYAPLQAVPSADGRRVLVFLCDKRSSGLCKGMVAFDPAAGVWEPLEAMRPAPPGLLSGCIFARADDVYMLRGEEGGRNMRCRQLYRYSYESNKWKKFRSTGSFVHNSLNCCAVVGNKVYLYSKSYKRMYVLDFLPSLRTLCMMEVNSLKLDATCLPESLQLELAAFHW